MHVNGGHGHWRAIGVVLSSLGTVPEDWGRSHIYLYYEGRCITPPHSLPLITRLGQMLIFSRDPVSGKFGSLVATLQVGQKGRAGEEDGLGAVV